MFDSIDVLEKLPAPPPYPWEAELTPAWWVEEELAAPVAGVRELEPSRLLYEALAGLVPDQLDDEAALDASTGWERLISHATAQQARVLARFAALRPGSGGRTFSEFAPDEVALDLHMTVNTAGNRLDAAVALTTRLPGTLAALDRGDIDPIRARIVADATALLSAAHARQVEERVLVRAPVQNASQLRAAVRRAVLAIDPDGAEQRHERSVAERQVRAHPLDDGMAELDVYAAAPDVAAAYAHVDRLARAARTAGDVRTLDQLRTDVVLDLLSGRTTPTTSTAQIQVTVAVTTLLGLDDQPAELRGYGPIPAGVARKIAADGVWRRLLTDPVSGTLLDYGRSTYRARDSLADHVRTRDVTCVFPGCRRPASACDLDHNLAYHEGGPTSHDNLGPLCRHHHRCKQQHGWTLTQPQPGTFIWTTPTGRQYTRPPEALGEPDLRSARDRPPRPLPLRAESLRERPVNGLCGARCGCTTLGR